MEGQEGYTYYVPAPVPPIIENIDDARLPNERCSKLSVQERERLERRKRSVREATVAQYYAHETVERASFYELLTPGPAAQFHADLWDRTRPRVCCQQRALGGGRTRGGGARARVAHQLGLSEDNFAINIVDLALLAIQNDERELDKAIWEMICSNVKNALRVIYNMERLEALEDHFALENCLEAKANILTANLVERAKERLERMVTMEVAKLVAPWSSCV